MMAFTNCNVVQGHCIIKKDIIVENGKISRLTELTEGAYKIIDCEGLFLAPGLIDTHIHGLEGYDILDSSSNSIREIAIRLAKRGITSFVPSIMTADSVVMKQALKNIDDAMSSSELAAEILGIHLEGPYISCKAAGAHDISYIIEPSVQRYKDLVGEYENRIRLITIAPEVSNAMELIRYLSSKGVVCAMGHTAATYEEAMIGIRNGMCHATHLYNCMSGLRHRAPGVVGAVFDSDIFAEIIGDGVTVSSVAFNIACKQKGLDKIILVSDAIAIANQVEGKYWYNNKVVKVAENKAVTEDGIIVGSMCTLDTTIKELLNKTKLDICDLVRIASENPARLIGMENKKGAIKPGNDADFILFNNDFDIERVYIQGRQLI